MSTDDETKPGLIDRAKGRIDALRERSEFVDQLIRTYEHYSNVQGNILAGAVTYFGYLSFFPVLALGFAVVGYVTIVYPGAKNDLISALQSVLPGLVGGEESGALIKVTVFEDAAGAATVIGLVGLLYSGLGWLSALRESLQAVFVVPPGDKRNFVFGKIYDLITLAVIGLVLIVSVGLSTAATSFLTTILGWWGVGENVVTTALLGLLVLVLGIVASTGLFVVMFKLLSKPDLPTEALLKGALFGAILFEVLKLLATQVIGSTSGNPGAAIVGTSLVLVVWINYFSRITLLSAAWASMTDEGRQMIAAREVEEVERIVAGDAVVPSAVGAFRPASTEAGAAAPWPVDIDEGDRRSAPPPAPGPRSDTSSHPSTWDTVKKLAPLAIAVGVAAVLVRRRGPAS